MNPHECFVCFITVGKSSSSGPWCFFRILERSSKEVNLTITVKPVLSGHSKIDKTKILMTSGCLMKVKSIAECSPWRIL